MSCHIKLLTRQPCPQVQRPVLTACSVWPKMIQEYDFQIELYKLEVLGIIVKLCKVLSTFSESNNSLIAIFSST